MPSACARALGIATVGLALTLRRHIGTIGALTAAALIALSPGGVYISRYFIHESQFVFFTLALVVAALRYWESADPVYLMLASISAALIFATKETAFISVAVLGLAWAVAAIYMRLAKRSASVPWEKKRARERKAKTRHNPQAEQVDALERFGGLTSVALMAGLALVLFVFVNILFYSSFFTYWKASEAQSSLSNLAKTGTKDHANNGCTLLSGSCRKKRRFYLGLCGRAFALSAAGIALPSLRGRGFGISRLIR